MSPASATFCFFRGATKEHTRKHPNRVHAVYMWATGEATIQKSTPHTGKWQHAKVSDWKHQRFIDVTRHKTRKRILEKKGPP